MLSLGTQWCWQVWKQRQRPHSLYLSSFMKKILLFIWTNAPHRFVTLPATVDSGLWQPGEKSDTFLSTSEVWLGIGKMTWLDFTLISELELKQPQVTGGGDSDLPLQHPVGISFVHHNLANHNEPRFPCIPSSSAPETDSRLPNVVIAWRCNWVRSDGS